MQPFVNISVSKTMHNQIFYRPSRKKSSLLILHSLSATPVHILLSLYISNFLKIIFGSFGKVCFDDRIEQYIRLFEIDMTAFFTFSTIVPAIVSILFH